MTKRFVRQPLLGVALGSGLLLALLDGTCMAGHGTPQDGRACLYPVEGTCQPRWSTWGYFQPQWRPWPTGDSGPISPPSTYGTSPTQRPGGISVELPPAEEEADRLPTTPGLPADLPTVVPQGAPAAEPNPFSDEQAEPSATDAANRGDMRGRATMMRAMADRARAQAEDAATQRPGNPYRRTVEREVAPVLTMPPADLSRRGDPNPLRVAGGPVRLPIPSRSRLTPIATPPELEATPTGTGRTVPAMAVEEAEQIQPVSYPSTEQLAPQQVLPPVKPSGAGASRNPLRR